MVMAMVMMVMMVMMMVVVQYTWLLGVSIVHEGNMCPHTHLDG